MCLDIPVESTRHTIDIMDSVTLWSAVAELRTWSIQAGTIEDGLQKKLRQQSRLVDTDASVPERSMSWVGEDMRVTRVCEAIRATDEPCWMWWPQRISSPHWLATEMHLLGANDFRLLQPTLYEPCIALPVSPTAAGQDAQWESP